MVLGSDLRWGNGRGVAAAAVLILAATLTACSDETGGSDTNPPTPSVEQLTSTEPSPTAPSDAAAAEQEVKKNWVKFFDPAVAQKDKTAVLENGDEMTEVLESFSGDQRGQEVKAVVDKVEFTSPVDANVTYTLLLNGATALPGATGTAVEQDGTWKVSVKTLCALVTLSGNASPGPGC